MGVSIHAPARGATVGSGSGVYSVICFNPRARAGRDKIDDSIRTKTHRFNPRARAGRDIAQLNREFAGDRFNPRARAGRDNFEQLVSL